VRSLFVMPSAGDESTVFGCCFYGYQLLANEPVQPFETLYLGVDWTDRDFKEALAQHNAFSRFNVVQPENIEHEIAQLLAARHIVARFAGRSEWGTRALGNRSILAHPAEWQAVREINAMIKCRDFWMPFAPAILDEDYADYVIDEKGYGPPFMNITFHTRPERREHLIAAVHQYDYTVRPQVVREAHNREFHAILKNFKALTGIGALLNTSFNLHGEPIVHTPHDALRTFELSGLRYLALARM